MWEVSAPASYLKSVDCSYDAQEPWHQWSISFSRERLLEAVQTKYAGVKEIHGIDVEKTGDSGVVMSLALDTGRESTISAMSTIYVPCCPRTDCP